MTTIRIGAASLNQTPVDWSGNRARMVAAIDEARSAGVRLLCLPELCVSGYGCEDLFFARRVRERALRELVALLPATQGIAVCVGLPLEVRGRPYNAAAMVADGRLLGLGLKQHLAGDGLHYEPRWFDPWPADRRESVVVGGEEVPVGDLVFDFTGVRVGLEICRDAWVADRPAKRLAERGVGVVLNPSASHFAFGKQEIRKRLAREGAEAIGGLFVYCNLLGNESGRSIYDGGTLFVAAGAEGEAELIAEGERFSYRDHTLTWIEAEVTQGKGGVADGVVDTTFDLSVEPADPGPRSAAPWETGSCLKHEEFSRAVPLGLLDYLRKSGARGFVLSLSGGADSAATAVLVWLMASFAEGQGVDLTKRLPNTPALGEAGSARERVCPLLLTLYQATRNSSETTRAAAATVADAVGAEHHEWSVDELVDGYVGLAEGVVGRPLDWAGDDLALQNIQARARAPGAWLLANLRDALLLTTGNRSEASVGYATMDGDTAGGLAPIAGVDKAFLREWLRWMETEGPEGVGPLSALAAVNAQQPTAELRPVASAQTDEADLMPYEVLDAIERSAIGRLEERNLTLAQLKRAFAAYDEDQLVVWVNRFHDRWRASQWKRERLAPSFHLDTIGVDPRTWRRWPILSGNPRD